MDVYVGLVILVVGIVIGDMTRVLRSVIKKNECVKRRG